MPLSPAAADLLGPYLARQRWYGGAGEPDPGSLRVLESECLAEASDGRRLQWAVVAVDGDRYQLLFGDAPAGEDEGSVGGPTGAAAGRPPVADGQQMPPAALVGTVGGRRLYDAVVDPELMLLFFRRLVGSEATKVRLVGAEQSNTSVVYDDRVIVKLYRRLREGSNPDIGVTTALAAGGFEHVAEPVATWRADGMDLAFAQRFLVGGAEGWALGVASAAASIGATAGDPGPGPGDFAAESGQLGAMTAGLHLALGRAFGVDDEALAARWGDFVDDLERRTAAETAPAPGAPAPAPHPAPEALERAFERLRAVRHPGPAIRLHGDYHLGQVMRSGGRWYALDFEGEPTRDFEERTRRSSPAKDVSGMLRSIDYAARHALRQVEEAGALLETAAERAAAWELRSRAAFLDGYRSTPGVEALTPGAGDAGAVLAAFELDKALYELRYEEAYRPDWVAIPRAAIGRIVERLGAGRGGG